MFDILIVSVPLRGKYRGEEGVEDITGKILSERFRPLAG